MIANNDWYTIRIVEGSEAWNQAGRDWKDGDTTLCSYLYMRDACTQAREGKYSGIPVAFCPECDEDMIFYEGDYICAWCREHFEDDL